MYPVHMRSVSHPAGITILETSAAFAAGNGFIALQELSVLPPLNPTFSIFFAQQSPANAMRSLRFLLLLKRTVWLISSLFLPTESSRAMC